MMSFGSSGFSESSLDVVLVVDEAPSLDLNLKM